MLNKVESKVMNYIFEKCKDKKSVLITPKELLLALMPKTELTAKELDALMKNLMLDEYIEFESGDKSGVKVYIIALTMKGAGYDRERQAAKMTRLKSLGWKVLLTVVGVVLAWLIQAIIRK
ncbi:MAG: hypothetical protein LBQ05_00500 [Christensenellaceae bacterium]|jgi:hypothetical protein|nr:hypothetical protein [Christensenellaceae bacterium]